MATQYEFVRLASAASTQDEARSRFVARPLLVAAARQEAGRGRSGRMWLAAPRAVFASLALRPAWPPQSWPLLTLTAALAARSVVGAAVGLKWPNDLVTAGGKVGGLLAEADARGVVLGLGVNLWWPAPPGGAAALAEEDPGAEAPFRMAQDWAAATLARLEQGPQRWGAAEYRAACVTLGTEITWSGPHSGSGLAEGITAEGALIVATGSGLVHLNSGEVHTVRPLR